MDLTEILEHLRTKGKRPSLAPEPGPRGLRPSVSPRVGTAAAPTVVRPEEVQPNDPRFRLGTPSPISDYYRDPFGKGPMGDVARYDDIVDLIKEAETRGDMERSMELRAMLPTAPMTEEKPRFVGQFPRVMDPQAYKESLPPFGLEEGIPTDEVMADDPPPMKRLSHGVETPIGLEHKPFGERLSEWTTKIGQLGSEASEQRLAAEMQSAGLSTDIITEGAERSQTIRPEYKEKAEKFSDTFNELIKEGKTHQEATDIARQSYDVPDYYWPFAMAVAEIYTFGISSFGKTTVREIAPSVPAVLRPAFKLFGEVVGIPDTIENIVVSSAIKTFFGTTRYGRDAIRMLKEGDGWTAAFSPDEQALYRQRMAQPGLGQREYGKAPSLEDPTTAPDVTAPDVTAPSDSPTPVLARTEAEQQTTGPVAEGPVSSIYGTGVTSTFAQRMSDDIHDAITGTIKAVPKVAGKIFDGFFRGTTRAADVATAKTIGRQPNLRGKYQSLKTNVLRIDNGWKKTLADRYEYVRAISQRIYRNIDASPKVKAMARNLENQLALIQNYKGQVKGTWNALLRDLNRNAPDLDFNDVEEYAYLQAARDAIRFEGDGNLQINIARQGEEPKIISTRKQANAAINKFKQNYSTTQRKTIVDGTTGAETSSFVNVREQLEIALGVMNKHVGEMRQNMVASGRISESKAKNLNRYANNHNQLYNFDEKDIGKIVGLSSKADAMENYQKLLATAFIKDSNNNMFKLIIDAAQQDLGPNGLARRIRKLTEREVIDLTKADFDLAEAEGLNIYGSGFDFLGQPPKRATQTMTFLRNGIEETWSVPKELNEIWGAANQFGFNNKAMKAVVSLSNILRASTTVFNPRFLLRALPADLYNYMAYEERNPLAAVARIGILGSSRIAYALGKQDTLYERVRDALMMAGGSQERTRGFEMAGLAPGKTRAAQAGKPVSIENDEQLNKLFTPEELKKTADDNGYNVATNEKEATSFAESTMGIIGIKTLTFPITALQAAAKKQEFAARLLTMYKVLDDELGGTMIGGIPSKRPAWMKFTSMELARKQAGQEAAARAVDVTLNFDRGGTAIKQMNTYIPFLNSTFEGSKHPFRRLFYGPTRMTTWMNLGYLMAADTAVTAHNMSYPEYYDVDTKIRYGSLFWITGYKMDSEGNYIEDENGKRQLNVTVFIPKFWNWGGALAVRTIMHEMLHQNDPSQEANAEYVEKITGDLPTWLQRAGEGLKALGNITDDPAGTVKDTLSEGLPEFTRQAAPIQIRGETLTDTVLNIYTVPALRAALSQVFNRNYYFGADIVPEAMRDYPPEEQVLPGTPRTYRVLGGMIDQSPLRVQQLVNDLFGGGAEVPVDIFDKIIDMFSPPYTEEDLQEFTEWATANRRERNDLEAGQSLEWKALMQRMARDPDLEQFDVAGLGQQEDEGFLGAAADLAGAAITPVQDVFRPTDTGKAAFVKGIEEVEKQTPLRFDDSKAVSDIMREYKKNIYTEDLELNDLVNTDNITWKTFGEKNRALEIRVRDELKEIENSGKYPNAWQFTDNTEQGRANRAKYFNLLKGEGILPNTTERGEALYRSIHDIPAEIEYLGVDKLIENSNYGKRLKEIQEKVNALSPVDKELYRDHELSLLNTPAKRERRMDINKIAESGYWDAGVPEFIAIFSAKYPKRIKQIEKWMNASPELKDDLTTLANIPDQDKTFYKVLERAYTNSTQRRNARSAILADNPHIRDLLIKHGYKEDRIPAPQLDEIEGYRRRLVPTLRT